MQLGIQANIYTLSQIKDMSYGSLISGWIHMYFLLTSNRKLYVVLKGKNKKDPCIQ